MPHRFHLRHYVERLNIGQLSGGKPVLFPLDRNDVETIHQEIECDASPENLHQDGEASARYVSERRRYLKAVHRELKKVDRWSVVGSLDV